MTRTQALEHIWMLHNTVEDNHRATIADRLELFEQTTEALETLGVTDDDYPEE